MLDMCPKDDTQFPKTICYTPDQFACIDEHIERHFGHISQVIADPSPVDPQIDLLVIAPNEQHDFYTVITRGMGSYVPYPSDKKHKRSHLRSELIICLHKDWQISQACQENDIWPLRLLLRLCHYPYGTDKPLSCGMSFDNGKPFAPDTTLSAVVMDELCSYFSSAARNCLLPNYEVVHFLQILPIYVHELYYLNHYGFNAFIKALEPDNFIISNFRNSNLSPETDYHSNVLSDSRWYERCLTSYEHDLEDQLSLYHLAWFIRFCYDSDLLSTDFYQTFPQYVTQCDHEVSQEEFLDLVTNQLGGIIDRRYFNDAGSHFVAMYLDSKNFPSYLSDLEDLAFNYLGTERYYKERSQHIASLLLPYDESIYSKVRSVLRSRLATINHQVFYDNAIISTVAKTLSTQLKCSNTYYPPLRDPAPLLAHFRHASRMSYFQEGYPVLIEVDVENLYKILKLSRHKVVEINSDDFALECLLDPCPKGMAGALELSQTDFFNQDHFRDDFTRPLNLDYYSHLFALLKDAYRFSSCAQKALKFLVKEYEVKVALLKNLQASYPKPEPQEAPLRVDHGTLADDDNSYPKITHFNTTVEMLYDQDEQFARSCIIESSEDPKENYFDLKTIYQDHDCISKPMVLAQLPIRAPYDSISYLPYLIETPGLSMHDSMEIFASWYQQFGALPAVFGTHMLEFITPEAIDEELAEQLCYELIALCPKIRTLIDDGIWSIEALQAELTGSKSFTLDFSPVVRSYNKPYYY